MHRKCIIAPLSILCLIPDTWAPFKHKRIHRSLETDLVGQPQLEPPMTLGEGVVVRGNPNVPY